MRHRNAGNRDRGRDLVDPGVAEIAGNQAEEQSEREADQGGGHEQRQGNWSAGRGRWNVATGLQDDNDLAVLIAFFRARAGRLHAFRFKDWSDYQLDRQVIGTTGGGDATWQILR